MMLSIVVNIIIPQLVAGIGSVKEGWTTISLIFAIPLTIIGLGRFLFIKEIEVDDSEKQRVMDQKTSDLTVGDTVKNLFANKYLFILAGITLMAFIINNLNTATTYYFKYIMGDIALASTVSATALVTPFVLMFYPMLVNKFGNGNVLRGGIALGLIGLAIRSVGGANMTTIITGTLLSTIGILPVTMMSSIFSIECMDYGEWKTGIRMEGAISAVYGFSNKLGSGLASGLTGVIMGIAGYNSALEQQTTQALTAIVGVYNWLPLVLYGVTFALTMLYDLDKKLPQIREEIKK